MFDNDFERETLTNIQQGLAAAGIVSYPLDLAIFETILEVLPQTLIEDRAGKWYETEKLRLKTAKDAKSTPQRRVELNLPYASKLFDYQTIGVDWLVKIKKGILADDPGLGKTIQALAAADLAYANKILVVTLPGTLQKQWESVAKSWFGFTAIAAVGTQKERLELLKKSARVKIISHQMLADRKSKKYNTGVNPYHELLFNEKWDAIIIDEAHKLQNRNSKMSVGASKLKSKYLFLLTGTPLWNRAASVWNLLRLVEPKKYSSYWTFVRKYCKIDWTPFGEKVGDVKPGMKNALRQELSSYMIRRTVDDVKAELPEVTFNPISYDLDIKQYVVLKQIQKNRKIEFMGVNVLFDSPMAALSGMRKFCSMPGLFGFNFNSPKDDVIQTIVDEQIDSERQVLIFAWHRVYVEYLTQLIEEKFKDVRVEYIHGDVPQKTRDKYVEEFKLGRINVLIASLPSLGVGVDFPSINTVIFAELDWTPAMIEQAWRRIYRVGSNGNRFVYFLTAKNSIESRIYAVFLKKQEVADDVLLLECMD